MSPIPESPVLFSLLDISLYGLLQMVYIFLVFYVCRKLYLYCLKKYCAKHNVDNLNDLPKFIPLWVRVSLGIYTLTAVVCGVKYLFDMLVNFWVCKVDLHYIQATLPVNFGGWFILVFTYIILIDFLLLFAFMLADFWYHYGKKVF